jgi:hypothetical protein
MDLGAVAQLAQLIASRSKKKNSDGLAQLLAALQPLLQRLQLEPLARRPEAAAVAGRMASCLIACDAEMETSDVERCVRTTSSADGLAGAARGLLDALSSLRDLAAQSSASTAAPLQVLVAQLDAWQMAELDKQCRQKAAVVGVLQAMGDSPLSDLQRQVGMEALLSAVIERLGTGLPQLVRDIDGALAKPGLTAPAEKVGSLAAHPQQSVHCIVCALASAARPPRRARSLPYRWRPPDLAVPAGPDSCCRHRRRRCAQLLRLVQECSQAQQAQLERFWVDPAEVQVLQRLGQGGSGQVYSGTCRHQPAAIKLLPLPAVAGGLNGLLDSGDRQLAALRRELCFLARTQRLGWQHACRWASEARAHHPAHLPTEPPLERGCLLPHTCACPLHAAGE